MELELLPGVNSGEIFVILYHCGLLLHQNRVCRNNRYFISTTLCGYYVEIIHPHIVVEIIHPHIAVEVIYPHIAVEVIHPHIAAEVIYPHIHQQNISAVTSRGYYLLTQW